MSAQLTDSKVEIAQISHELRNPVAFINSSLQLISKEHPEVQSYHYWKNVVEEVQHLRQLLNDISSLQAGNSIFMETVSFHSFATSLLDSLLPALLEKEQALCLELPQKPISISLDKHKIRQVLENLIKNASEASPAGSTIHWKISITEDYLINEITDPGIGITPGYEHTLFNPFVTTKPTGTGLGLSICKEIVERHGGCIYYHDNKPVGTTFGFRIPYSINTKI